MTKSRIGNILVAAIMCLLPLAGATERLLHPAPWVAFAATTIILLTQPPLDPKKMVGEAMDRFSGLAIFVGMIASLVVSLVDFGYRSALRPSPVSAFMAGGAVAVVAGLALRLWSIRTLGRFFTSTVHIAEGQTVVDHGPYALLRHPSYTGALTAIIGVTVCLGSAAGLLCVALLSLPAYLIRVSVEEAALVRGLGRPYQEYRARTWRLVPFVY